MTHSVLLNNIDHAGLRVDTRRGADLGDAVMSAPTFPAEFRQLQAHYPVVFQGSGDGTFQPVALFGLEPGRNLFLEGARWDAAYLPLAVERGPFRIGETADGPMVHVDLDHPRVRSGRGEPLFREHGGHTELLERIRSVLLALREGLGAVPAFVEALQRHRLLEPFVLDVRLDDGSQGRLAGFHAVDEDRLRGLGPAALGELHARGHLEAVYMAVASVSRFRDLIDRLNRRHGRG
ncbi:SapC family protein [Luteimonas sp. RD2P54]|uniref:SapC family protein n=1 Tax=Luteimonas endophytica TaxID=3042023 RepID=A0ABT6JCI4_9GAMM|nr:SapC family protein [Luteimonas endophytica]MDH5824522.1 SapC family protein [Luteimonas endophytica]